MSAVRIRDQVSTMYGLQIRHFFTAYVVPACVVPWWREHFGTVSHNWRVSGVLVRFWYVSAKHVCSFWYVSAVRSLLRSPARCAALQPCTLPGALPHAAAVDALTLHALQSSCSSSFFMLLPKRPPLHCFSFELHPHPLLPSTLPFLSTQPP